MFTPFSTEWFRYSDGIYFYLVTRIPFSLYTFDLMSFDQSLNTLTAGTPFGNKEEMKEGNNDKSVMSVVICRFRIGCTSILLIFSTDAVVIDKHSICTL